MQGKARTPIARGPGQIDVHDPKRAIPANSYCGRLITSADLTAQRNECSDARVSHPKPGPDEQSQLDSEEIMSEQGTANAGVRRDGPAEIPGQ